VALHWSHTELIVYVTSHRCRSRNICTGFGIDVQARVTAKRLIGPALFVVTLDVMFGLCWAPAPFGVIFCDWLEETHFWPGEGEVPSAVCFWWFFLGDQFNCIFCLVQLTYLLIFSITAFLLFHSQPGHCAQRAKPEPTKKNDATGSETCGFQRALMLRWSFKYGPPNLAVFKYGKY
jgi:hypothetical protein